MVKNKMKGYELIISGIVAITCALFVPFMLFGLGYPSDAGHYLLVAVPLVVIGFSLLFLGIVRDSKEFEEWLRRFRKSDC